MSHSSSSPNLAHHFDDLAQQKESATLGMWLFLATEVMLFGAIFTAYIVYRRSFYDYFVIGSNHLYVSLGTLNTVVLLASSFAMALAVHSGHEGNNKNVVRFIVLTMLLGSVFLCIKAVEYSIDYKEGLIPLGSWWENQGEGDAHIKLFFVFYFLMTLLHAIHMTAGMGVLAWIAWLAKKGRFSAEYSTPVEMAGLYWHFVDIVWVFLFPSLYMINLALKSQVH